MKDMIQTGKFLFICCAIAGVLLAFTEMVTAQRIKENQNIKFAKACKDVLKDAEGEPQKVFVPTTDESGLPATQTFFLFNDKNGNPAGTVLNVSPKGYGGSIELVMGFAKDFSLTGVKVQDLKETPGLGTKIKDDFLKNFHQKLLEKKNSLKIALKKDRGEIDGISGATVSSRAFCKGVREGFEFAQKNKDKVDTFLASGPPKAPQAGDPFPIVPPPKVHPPASFPSPELQKGGAQ